MRNKHYHITVLMTLILSVGVDTEILYEVVDLDGPSGVARYINDMGQIVGSVEIGGTILSMVWDPADDYSYSILTTGSAYCINNSGQIVGTDVLGAYLFNPVEGGGYSGVWLGPGVARAINDNGQIVGWSGMGLYDQGSQAIIFDPTDNQNNIVIPDWYEITYSYGATAVNNNGILIGTSSDGKPFGSGGGLYEIGTGYSHAMRLSFPYSINDSGFVAGADEVIVGWSDDPVQPLPDLMSHAAVCHVDDPTITLLVPENTFSEAFSINEAGDIVGHINYDATLFDPTGGFDNIDLNTLIDPASD